MEKLPLPEGNSQESKIRRILFNEVNLILAVISIVGVVYAIFFGSSYKFQKQIDDIKNEVSTEQKLSAQLQNIKDNDMVELKTADRRIEEALLQIQKDIVKLQTTVDNHINIDNQ